MFGIPSIKNMGIIGAIVAVLAYLFRDNPLIQGLLSMFTGNEANAAEKPAALSGASSSGALTTKQTPQEKAAAVMENWKQQMEAQKTPESVRQALLSNEPQLLKQFEEAFATSKTEKQLQERLVVIQYTALSDATKPQFDAFVSKAEKQLIEQMDKIRSEITQNSNLPADEKSKALKALREEKELRIDELKKVLGGMPIEKRVALGVSAEEQDKILKQQLGGLSAYKEEIGKNISNISRQHSGWAYGSSILGWTSAGLAVGGLVAAPFTGGLSLGLTAAACGTGMAAGACKVINNSDKHGSNFDWGLGVAEIGLNAVPMAGLATKTIGLFAKSAGATATASGSLVEKAIAYVPGVSKASIVEGSAMQAVGRSATSLKNILGEGTQFVPKDTSHAVEVMKAITSGQATVQEVVKSGNTVSQVVLKNSAGVTTTYKDDLAKLVGQAITEHKFYDPIAGKSINGFRALTELTYTTMDDTVNSFLPSKTPEKLSSAKNPAKTTSTF